MATEFVKELQRKLRRIETEDVLLIVGALALLYSFLSLVLRELDAHNSTWLLIVHGKVVGTYNWLGLPLQVLAICIFSAVVALYLIYGPPFRRYLERRFPRSFNALSRILTHNYFIVLMEILSTIGVRRRPPTTLVFPLTMTFPSSWRDKRDANRLAKHIWHDDTPSISIELGWHWKNAVTQGIVRDGNGEAVAYFDFFPVRKTFVTELAHGIINEFDLVDHLIPDSGDGEALLQTDVIYVAGIVRTNFEQDESATALLGQFVSYSLMETILRVVILPRKTAAVPEIDAVGFGPQGERLCKIALGEYGVRKMVRIDENSEPHPWYSGRPTVDKIRKLSHRFRQGLTRRGTITRQTALGSFKITWDSSRSTRLH